MVKVVKDKLMSNPCRNQGFVLDGFPKTYDQAKELFYGETLTKSSFCTSVKITHRLNSTWTQTVHTIQTQHICFVFLSFLAVEQESEDETSPISSHSKNMPGLCIVITILLFPLEGETSTHSSACRPCSNQNYKL